MAFLTRKRAILLKTESTYGTDASPSGTDALIVKNLDITPISADLVTRDVVRPYLGAYSQLLANQKVELSFEVEWANSGTAGTAPRWGPAMLACGTSATTVANTSVTYAPVSSSFSSCTIYYFADGIKHAVTGWRGSVVMAGQVGQIPTFQFKGTGIYNAPSDTSVGAVTYANQADPMVFRNGNTSNFSLYGHNGCLQSFSFDLANEVVYRELVGCTKEVLITNRNPNGNAMIEAVSLATKDYFSAAIGTATGALTLTHGSTAGNRLAFNFPQVDITTVPYADSNGVIMFNPSFVALPTSAGNDEFSIVCT